MDKPIRKAVRCYLIKDNKVIVTKYKEGNKKAGYYEIPGGKIEEGETPEQSAIREMKEETGLKIRNLKYRGNMTIEYPNRIFDFDVFICNECEGKPQNYEENTSEWIEINELLKKEKILSNIMILDRFFIKGLIDDRCNFKMEIQVDEKENILDVKYRLEEKKKEIYNPNSLFKNNTNQEKTETDEFSTEISENKKKGFFSMIFNMINNLFK